MTYGLTLQPEEEPTQVETRSRGDTSLSIGEFDPQVVRRRTGTGKVTFGCAAGRPELRIVPAESSINTGRLGRIYLLEPRFRTVKVTSPVNFDYTAK